MKDKSLQKNWELKKERGGRGVMSVEQGKHELSYLSTFCENSKRREENRGKSKYDT